MKKNFLALLIAAIFFGSSCNNDDNGGTVPLTGYERMVDKTYRLVGLEVQANGVIIADSRDLLNCELDDLYRYESSGTAITNYGLLKCDPAEPQEEYYFWTLISNDSKLILDYNGPNLSVYNILINDGIRLELERYTIEDVDNNGIDESVRTILTYTRN